MTIPEYLEEIKIKAGAQIEQLKQSQVLQQPIILSPLLADLKAKIDYINDQMGKIQSLPEARQAEVLDLLRQANTSIDEIKPHL